MSTSQHQSSNVAAVLATIGHGQHGVARHDLPGNVTVSVLFDRDAEHRHTCQWRVVAPDETALRIVVAQLTVALDNLGVFYDQPRIAGATCHFRDHGPWPSAAG